MSTYSTITASVVQISAAGALGSMLTKLSARTIDPFSSSFFSTRAYAHGVERDSHEETVKADRKSVIRNKFEISRAFDLVSMIMVVIDVPGLKNTQKYVDNLGPALIEQATLSMGGHALAQLTGGLILCMEELGGKVGKSCDKLWDMEDGTAENVHDKAQRLYVPLTFWFTKSLSKALNLVGSSFQRAYIDLVMRPLRECVRLANGNVLPDATAVSVEENIPTNPMLGLFNPAAAGDNQSLEYRCTIDTHGITLNEDDRNTFSQVNAMTLMDEVHFQDVTLSDSFSIDLTTFAKNLVFEVIVANAADDAALKAIDYDEEIDTISMDISGQSRFPADIEGRLYSRVMPWIHHSQVPDKKGIHSLPFSYFPEDTLVPDSHVNCSKLDSLTLKMSGSGKATVFCLAYNLLVEQRGMKARFFV